MTLRRSILAFGLPALVLAAGSPALAQPTALLERPASAQPQKQAQSATAPHAMVAAANPLAVKAGTDILKAGGSAVDAAVAIQAVLGLVEPQSSGLGGGAFMVYYDAKTRQATAYDGREVAPAGASDRLFLDKDGNRLPFVEAVLGGISTGVPGAVAMLDMAHRDHGKLPWSGLFDEARSLATDGFTVSPRLAGMIASKAPQASAPDAKRYFTKADGTPYVAGDRLRNADYAQSLDRIARYGASGLLTGPLAQKIVDRVHQESRPGTITLADLANYRPHSGPALCRPYRVYLVCTPQAPSGGPGLQIALGVLEHTDIAKRDASDEKAWFQFAQASRLAYADRDRYVGDPAFVQVPLNGLLAPAYLQRRAAEIGERAGPVTFGLPNGAPKVGPDTTQEPGGTSHIVIVDAAGNVVSMTTTVESIFGSGRMVGGFFLNNQLTDFSFSPTDPDGAKAANAPAPGKRPRSSMAPAIVLTPQRKFVAAAGSPGGSAIQAYNLKVLVALLDWKMTPQDAVALPNLVAKGDTYSADAFPQPILEALAARNMPLSTSKGEESGLQAVIATPKGYVGGADPRREGVARGL
ncbi:MAG: gamma-glutamyltransferase [Novosphingobium lindaniclasticum]|jgi:gamma-glutamyltranspeptidase/glutathione hydrolase|uniref:gamma-glutamyltransferase family protein n=1 Tax=Novosphingobium lindaniclasticum TaxID=1329895 RepID=UPI002409BE6D|nr:gamma-glutamyltransferase family protein [Novosphingobium lindaniclasticum]MDF2640057.1 gamma-glutamyltransferase [Novosphingobium lindaniclasticum]